MSKNVIVGIIVLIALLAGCKPIGSEEVVDYLKTVSIKGVDSERGETRFTKLGQTSLKLLCRRVGEAQAICHLVPVAGKFSDCAVFVVTRKPTPDFSNFFMGELNRVKSAGKIPAAQCLKR